MGQRRSKLETRIRTGDPDCTSAYLDMNPATSYIAVDRLPFQALARLEISKAQLQPSLFGGL